MSAVMQNGVGWSRIPGEMANVARWLVSAPSSDVAGAKRPLYPNGAFGMANGSVHGPYMTFDAACACAGALRSSSGKDYGVGYVLAADDPFVIIDLDDKPHNPASDEDKALFAAIIKTMDSYTEISSSGRGAHIVVRANVTTNFRRGHVECYSSKRFMIMTGNVIRDVPVADRTELIANMTSQMLVSDKPEEIELDDAGKEGLQDEEVFNRAKDSANGEKFMGLWRGDLSEHGDDHSSADASLMQFLWFHARNKTQCVRMFGYSKLGDRDKWRQRVDYQKRTLSQAITRLHNDETRAAHVTFSEVFLGIAPIVMPKEEPPQLSLVVDNTMPQVDFSGMMAKIETANAPPKVDRRQMTLEVPLAMRDVPMPEPYGKLGALVRYMEQCNQYPTREIALGGALGLLAGVAGCAYQTVGSPTGLNQYFIIVAKSGTGKEGMKRAISNVLNAIEADGKTSIRAHVDFTNYGSPQSLQNDAILKAIPNSVVHVSSEWGQQMKAMATSQNVSTAAQYRKLQLEMFMASSRGQITAARKVLTKENAAEARGAFAYTILSETNPQTFFDSFTDSDAEDGFLSRIFVLEYQGTMPQRNRNVVDTVPKDVVEDLSLLATQVKTINDTIPSGAMLVAGQRPVSHMFVPFTPDADETKEGFLDHCEDRIRAYQESDDMRQHVWMRANVKVLRLATLIAVYENPIRPMVTSEMLRWAIAMNECSMHAFLKRHASGELGSRGLRAYTVILNAMRTWARGGYKMDEKEGALFQHNLISQTTLSRKVTKQLDRDFGEKRQQEFEKAIKQLKDEGRIAIVQGAEMREKFGMWAQCYRVISVE